MFVRVVISICAIVAAVGWTLTATVPSVVDMGLAIGLTGSSGTLTVLECHDVRSGRSSKEICTGSFVYDSTGQDVTVRAFSWAERGHVYPAQITAGGDRAGFRGVQGALAALPFPCLGLAFIAAAGAILNSRFFNFFTIMVIGAVIFAGIAIGFIARLF